MGEFDLIARYFTRQPVRAVLGVGDDCALLQPRQGTQLAISSDMLVEGRHFFADVDARKLGHKALAVNLSDLAACGAKPLAFTLALALPRIDESWLAGFSAGLWALADTHGCELVGGDTTQGPLTICITVFGEVEVIKGQGQALRRSGARAGDDLYVSGTLGDARLALEGMQHPGAWPDDLLEQARLRLEQPEPRVALGLALRGIASAAIDISDGLLGDLTHVLKASGCGATVHAADVAPLLAAQSHPQWRPLELARPVLDYVLAGGDDYELAFTAAPSQRNAVKAAAALAGTPVTRIGRMDAEPGLRLLDAQGQRLANSYASFDHFA